MYIDIYVRVYETERERDLVSHPTHEEGWVNTHTHTHTHTYTHIYIYIYIYIPHTVREKNVESC